MSTAQIQSVSIAAESSFGNIQSTTGLPTPVASATRWVSPTSGGSRSSPATRSTIAGYAVLSGNRSR